MTEPSVVPDLSLIIVSWNVVDLLRSCLRSILDGDGLTLQIIVVDSASADESVEMVRQEFPQVECIACTANVGFPRGNNIGLELATGRYVMLLNPDTEVIGDALEQLVKYMDEHPEVGVVGPQLLNSDGSVQSSRRRFPSLATGMFESTWLQDLAPANMMADYYVLDVADDQTAAVDWVVGAALLTRLDIVREIGGLDEAYFMYSEELDWCRRIKQAGWEVVYFPAAQIIHHYGKSSEQASTQRHINFNRAKLRYYRKYHGRWAAAWLRLVLLLNYLFQILVEGGKGLVGHKPALRRQRVQAYWTVLRSGLRPAGYG